MTVYQWPTGVNKRIYGLKQVYQDNTVRTESDSGIVLAYAKGTWTPRRYEASLHMTKTEFEAFDSWYRNTLRGTAGVFSFPDLSCTGGTACYRFAAVPELSATVYYRDVSLTFEEVPA